MSSLCASDLDATTGQSWGLSDFCFPHIINVCSNNQCFFKFEVTGNRRLHPTSPLKDYSDPEVNRRRRSRSASVRFVDETCEPEQVRYGDR